MKQKDIALIALVVVISAVVSLMLSKVLFGGAQVGQQKAEVVQPITSDFPQPDTHYFNKDAFDPTKPVTIGQDANPDPFSGSDVQQ
jgi:hypothetical protein